MIEDETTAPLAFSEPAGLELCAVIEGTGQKSLSRLGYESYKSLLTGLVEGRTLRLLGDAFAYRIGINWGGKNGFRAHLEPEVPGSQSWPTELREVSAPVVETWAYLYSQLRNPVVRAHFGDLFLSASRRPDLSIPRVYVSILDGALQDESWNHSDRYLMAIRALSMCNQFKLFEVRQTALEAIRREIQKVLDNGTELSKSFLWLLRSYRLTMAMSATGDRARVTDDLLYDQFWEQLRLMKVDDYIAEDLLGVAKNQEHKKEIQSRHVQAKIDAGQAASEAFQKLHHFESAAGLAKRYGLQGLYGEAIRWLQESRNLEIQWEKVQTTVRMPTAAYELELRRLTSRDNWESPLEMILRLPAPTGDYDSNLRQAEKLVSDSPFRHTVTNKTIGLHGLPEKTRTTHEQAVAADLTMVESFAAQTHANLIGHALTRMKTYFPELTGTDIAVYMSEELGANPGLSTLFGKALEEFWNDNYEQVAFHILFQIEAAMRELLLSLGVPIYVIQVSESRGRFPSLDTYLDKLESEGFDLDWSRAIKSLLLSDGMNLRNLVAHGYPVHIGRLEAVLLLRVFGLFALIVPPTRAMPFPTSRRASHKRQRAAHRNTRKVLSAHRKRSRRN